MRAVLLVLSLLALSMSAAAHARTSLDPSISPAALDGVVRIGSAREEPLDVGGGWRVRFDDDARYADPAFDDRAWGSLLVPRGIGMQGHAGFVGVFWMRLRLHVDDGADPLALRLPAVDSAYELYVDGTRAGTVGHIPQGAHEGEIAYDNVGLFVLPSAALQDGDVVIALRIWRAPERASAKPLRGGPTHGPILVGDPLRLQHDAWLADLDDIAAAAVFFVVGAYHLHLFRRRRELVAYQWFGLFALCVAVYTVVIRPIAQEAIASSLWRNRIGYLAMALLFPVVVEFVVPFLGGRLTRPWRILQGITLVWAPACALWPTLWLSQCTLVWWEVVVVVPTLASITVFVGRRARAGDPEARTIAIGIAAMAASAVNNVGAERNLWAPVELTSVAMAIFVLSMAVSLSNRFTRVFAELDDKNATLQRMDKLKDEFLANTSHELRTPLHGILGITSSLLDGTAGALPDAAIDDLRLVQHSGQRLSTLIEDILDFSKLREGKLTMQLRPVDLRSSVDVVVRVLGPLARRKHLWLDNRIAADTAAVLADEDRLQQVLTNLIGNAVKFTERGGVYVQASVHDDVVAVEVVDTGIGIAPADHARIFRGFEQVDGSAQRRFGGAGLGLSITRSLVELMAGRIELRSAVGAGSCFRIELPRAPHDAAAAPAASRAPASSEETERANGAATTQASSGGGTSSEGTSSKGTSSEGTSSEGTSIDVPSPSVMARSDAHDAVHVAPIVERAVPVPAGGRSRVLVVDDDPINVRVLENYLAGDLFDVVGVDSGAEALAHVAQHGAPDLVLLDVMMPRMSGFEVCQLLRAQHPAHELPIFLVTAKDRVADVVHGFEAGASDYLTKPIARGELLARIRAHLGVARMQEASARFVPHEFLQLLGKESLADVAHGDQVQREMSVLFSDIRSFTTIVEKNTPAENFRFINEYLAQMEPAITDVGGFVDSFIGDAIMALFDGHQGGALDAVRAGIGMQNRLRTYNVQRQRAGAAPLSIGIGVNTGLLTCGTIGGREHIKCGVIGDTVNTAARIEGMTKMYQARFLVGDDTRAHLPVDAGVLLREVDRVQAKGKTQATTIWEVLDAEDDETRDARARALPRYREMLALYRARAFDDAQALLGELQRERDDGVLQLYARRCAALRATPPGPDWDFVVKLESK